MLRHTPKALVASLRYSAAITEPGIIFENQTEQKMRDYNVPRGYISLDARQAEKMNINIRRHEVSQEFLPLRFDCIWV
jgi:hypothetical protein